MHGQKSERARLVGPVGGGGGHGGDSGMDSVKSVSLNSLYIDTKFIILYNFE